MHAIFPERSLQRISFIYLVVLIAMIFLSILIPKGQDVLWINGMSSFPLDLFFSVITNLGDGIIFLPIVVALLFVNFRTAISFTALSALLGIIITIMKRVIYVDAGRPITYLDRKLLHFVDGVSVHAHYSFPSGHTATIFAATFALALYFHRNLYLNTVLLVVAVLVGYSRIYLLQHFLIDVTIGAVTGTFTALLVFIAMDSINTPRWMDGRIRLARSQKDEGYTSLGQS